MRSLNLPNKLTLLRILLVPFILLCFSLPPWGMWIAVVLFVIAAVTDTLDGLVISGLRLVAAGKGVVLAAGSLGKIKTTLQDIALPFLMVGDSGKLFRIMGLIVLYASLFMSLWSAWDYVYKNRNLIRQE